MHVPFFVSYEQPESVRELQDSGRSIGVCQQMRFCCGSALLSKEWASGGDGDAESMQEPYWNRSAWIC
jgi:hypothetical protein